MSSSKWNHHQQPQISRDGQRSLPGATLVQKSVELGSAIVVKPGLPAYFGHVRIFDLAKSDPIFAVLVPRIFTLFYALAIDSAPARNAAGLGALVSSGLRNFLLVKFVLCIFR